MTPLAAVPTAGLTASKPSGKRFRGARDFLSNSPPLTPKSIGTVPSTAVAALKVSIALKSAALGADDGAESAAALATIATSAAVCDMAVLDGCAQLCVQVCYLYNSSPSFDTF